MVKIQQSQPRPVTRPAGGNGIPFTVIGGFLGAGKTTLLNRFLSQPNPPRCAVLVNDFGDIAVDEALIRQHDGQTVALRNGCVCCSIGSDLSRALVRVMELDPRPQHILVEASGVADPDRVADIARIAPDLDLHGIVVLVDGKRIVEQLGDRWASDTVERQLCAGDRVLVSKTDRLSQPEIRQVMALLAARLGADRVRPLQGEDLKAMLTRRLSLPDRQPNGEALPHPFTTRTLRGNRPLALTTLRVWLQGRSDIYRLKGWARDPQSNQVLLIQGVGDTVTACPALGRDVPGFELLCIGSKALPSAASLEAELVALL